MTLLPILKRLLIPLLILVVVYSPSAQIRHIYLANDNHTDYYWTANDVAYTNVAINEIDYYLGLTEATLNLPAPHQSRYNLDCAWYVYEYQQNKTPEEFQVLIDRIKSGHMSIPLNWLVSTYGGQPTEAVLRGMYWPGKLARDYDLDISLAVSMENQTNPLGLASLWAGSGARYSWKGVCSCASTILPIRLANRNHEIYKYSGLDGLGVLMKWYSFDYHPYGLGGYAEAWDLSSVFSDCIDKCNTEEHPYNIVGAFGYAGDDLINLTDAFHNFAIDHTDENNQIYVSNEVDFFEHFENEYDENEIPVESLSYGNEWDLNCATLAPVTAKMRNSIELLRTAEALASIISLKEPGFYAAFEEERSTAWRAIGSFWDHNFGLGGCCYPERNDWQIMLQEQVTDYVDNLLGSSLNALGQMISGNAKNQRFFVFNPLGWTRSGYFDMVYDGPENIRIFDISTNTEIPFQLDNESNLLRIFATDIPAVGYKVFDIQNGAGQEFPVTGVLDDNIFENDYFQLTLTPEGVITSLIDKAENTEFGQETNGRFINDFGQGNGSDGTMTLLNNGPVSATVQCTSPNPLQHTTNITLHKYQKRIDIRNHINDEFGNDQRTYSFSFELDNPTLWHEELGAILKAKYEANGGHYANADQPVRYDYLTLNHFADIGNDQKRVVLSNKGAAFMKPGSSSGEFLDEQSSQINVLIGGIIRETENPHILNQYGLTNFQNDFAIHTYHNSFDAEASMKFAMEHQNPLVGGYVQGGGNAFPSTTFSLVSIDNPNLLLWALKPAEAGINDGGLVLRVWNMDSKNQPGVINFSGNVLTAYQTNHLETNLSPAYTEANNLLVNPGKQSMETFRVFLDELTDSLPEPEPSFDVSIFPNPNSSGKITIQISTLEKPAFLKVYNPKGQLLFEDSIRTNSYDLDTRNYSSGIYLFQLSSGEKAVSKKVFVVN
ncbi:MAG: T9SS C-terminal target domain-containing protein [Bacteroidetes bacterium]|nr:MAG: T9SS C-terminal target domain-containing protein [Bacteroidota bacterium]